MATGEFKQKITIQFAGAEKAERGAKKLGSSMSDLKGKILAVGGAYFGSKMLIDGITKATEAYRQQELAEKKLSIAMGGSTGALRDQAAALQKQSVFGDEAIITQQAFLASLDFTESQIKDIIPVAMDLSAATGISLESAVRNTAKTFSGLAGELGELIPQLRGLTAEQMKAGDAVEIMADLFGGQASQATDTLDGKIRQFQNSLGDLWENVGDFLLPAITGVIDGFNSLVETVGGWFGMGVGSAIEQEALAFDGLLGALIRVNPESESRALLIERINREHPKMLGGLDLEEASLEDLIKLQKESNDLYLAKMAIQMHEKELAEQLEEQAEAAKELVDVERELDRAYKKKAALAPRQMETGNMVIDLNIKAANAERDAVEGEIFRLEKKREKKMAFFQLEKAITDGIITNNADLIAQAEEIVQAEEDKATALAKSNEAVTNSESEKNEVMEEAVQTQESYNESQLELLEHQKQQQEFIDFFVEKYPEQADALGLINSEEREAQRLQKQKEKNDATDQANLKKEIELLGTKRDMFESIAIATMNLMGLNEKNAKHVKNIQAAASLVDAYYATQLSFKQAQANPITIANPAYPYIVSAATLSKGLANAAAVSAAAEGMDTLVTEPTLILAGEEGPEYVDIEPTMNEGAGRGGANITITGNVLSKDFIEDEAVPMIREALRKGGDIGIG